MALAQAYLLYSGLWRYLIMLVLVCTLVPTPAAAAPRALIPWSQITVSFRDSMAAIYERPDVQVSKRIARYGASPAMLDSLLQELDLAGDLWRAYACRPPYVITRLSDRLFKVQERAYLGGTVEVVYHAPGHWVYFVRGWVRSRLFGPGRIRVDGASVIVLQTTPTEHGLRGEIHIYSVVNQKLIGYTLRLLRPLLQDFVVRHTEIAIANVRKISLAVAHDPSAARDTLASLTPASQLLSLFDRLFPSTPAEDKTGGEP